MNSFVALLKREYLEHKASTFWFPVVFSAIAFTSIAILSVYGVSAGEGLFVTVDGQIIIDDETTVAPLAAGVISVVVHIMAALAFMTVLLVQGAYFLGSFYDDRKDQSIIFWRSLPVAEWQTLLSKLVYGSLVLPAFYFLAAVVVALATLILGLILLPMTGIEITGLFTLAWITEPAKVMISLIPIALWLMPVWLYFMCASAVAKRLPVLYAAAPFVMLAIIWGISDTMGLNLGIQSFYEAIGDYFGRFFAEELNDEWTTENNEMTTFAALRWQFLFNFQQLAGSVIAAGLAVAALVLRQRSETV